MPPIDVDEFLRSFDLRDLLSVLLWESSRKSRQQSWGPCPFCCPDRVRATCFSVSHLLYFCHRCNETGTAISLIRKLHNVSFLESVTQIAALTGVPIPFQE